MQSEFSQFSDMVYCGITVALLLLGYIAGRVGK